MGRYNNISLPRAYRLIVSNGRHYSYSLHIGNSQTNSRLWTHHKVAQTALTHHIDTHNLLIQIRNKSSSISKSNSNSENSVLPKASQDPDTYAVAQITPLTTAIPSSPRSLKLTTKNLSIEEILHEAPGTHARDFFSLSLTSVGEAESRKRRARYSVNKIHPWFIFPRETEIIVSSLTLLVA